MRCLAVGPRAPPDRHLGFPGLQGGSPAPRPLPRRPWQSPGAAWPPAGVTLGWVPVWVNQPRGSSTAPAPRQSPTDAIHGSPGAPAPACETRHVPGNLLPVVSGRVSVGDAVPSGEIPIGAAGPHGPGTQGQLAGLQPCRQTEHLSALSPGRGRDGPTLPASLLSPWLGTEWEPRERTPCLQGRQGCKSPRPEDQSPGGPETVIRQGTPRTRGWRSACGVPTLGNTEADACCLLPQQSLSSKAGPSVAAVATPTQRLYLARAPSRSPPASPR